MLNSAKRDIYFLKMYSKNKMHHHIPLGTLVYSDFATQEYSFIYWLTTHSNEKQSQCSLRSSLPLNFYNSIEFLIALMVCICKKHMLFMRLFVVTYLSCNHTRRAQTRQFTKSLHVCLKLRQVVGNFLTCFSCKNESF